MGAQVVPEILGPPLMINITCIVKFIARLGDDIIKSVIEPEPLLTVEKEIVP